MPDDPTKPPRLPYVAALLCIACLGAAVWTWMRYSFAHHLTPDSLHRTLVASMQTGKPGKPEWLDDGYVEVDLPPHQPVYHVGQFQDKVPGYSVCVAECEGLTFSDGGHLEVCLRVVSHGDDARLVEWLRSLRSWKGRFGVYVLGDVSIDMTASRFHPASIAGLVVGAMGVFLFTVALRHWLGERRKFRERDEGA